MDDYHDSRHPPTPKELRWGLLIRMMPVPGVLPPQYEIRFDARNQGMNESDVILMVERWLDLVKDRHKRDFLPGLDFGGGPSDAPST